MNINVSNCDYVREYYGVNACIRRRVIVNGKPGIIAADRGHYIGVNLDSDKPGVISNCHPTAKVEYLEELGTIRKQKRGQARYQSFMDLDFDITFAEYLGIDTKCETNYYAYRFKNRRLTGPWKALKKDAKTAWKKLLKENPKQSWEC